MRERTAPWLRALALGERLRGLNALVPLIICLALAIFAQQSLDRREDLALAWGAYGLAALAFGLLFHRVGLEGERKAAPVERRRGRPLPLLVGLVLGLLAFPRFAGNRFTPLGTFLWLGGVGLALWALRDRAPREMEPGARLRGLLGREGIALSWEGLALLGIVAVGAFLRFYQLDAVPREMGVDLPHIYNNVRHILRGEYLIFFPSHPGREGLFCYLIALYARFFGLSHFAIKATGALIGLLTIPALYLLARELFSREVALYASAFLALGKWPVILSRTGYRATTMPLFVILVLYFLARALTTRRPLHFGLAGLCLGLGLYTYSAFLLMPLAVLLGLAAYSLADRGRLVRENWVGIFLMFLLAALAFIPLGRYAYENPDRYFFRVSTRITGREVPLPQDPVMVFLNNLRRSLLMFNYVGDGMFYINVPFQRQLGFFSGLFFVLGTAYVLFRWRRGYNVLIPVFLVVMLLPSALSLAFPGEVPNAVRAVGVIGPAFLLVALPLPLIRRVLAQALSGAERREIFAVLRISPASQWEKRWALPLQGQHLFAALVVPILVWEGYSTYQTYFHDYVYYQPDHNYSISLEMARAIDDFAGDGPAYIKVWPFWYDGNAVRAQLRVQSQDWAGEITGLDPSAPPLSTLQGKAMFILHPEDEEALSTLRQFFPRGVAVERRDQEGRVTFITFYGER
ncbi:MAG: glycosyltransferase family 39 protein [Anaerolineae bacterium]